MMSAIYFIQEHHHLRVAHGGIGNADADNIWLQLGYIPIAFPDRENFSLPAKVRRSAYLMAMYRRIQPNDTVVFQFPMYAGMSKLLVRLLLRKKIRFICFITDIDGLKDGDPDKLQREIRFLARFRFFIVHNESMKNWLSDKITGAVTAGINFFDFLAAPFSGDRFVSKELVFAGNLSKSLFLEKLDELQDPLQWNVYGPGFTPQMAKQACIDYKGIVDPRSLPSVVAGSFGVVWDGDSIHGSGGVFGEYMSYITHHKVSLYIIAGLPIICYRHAGAARLIDNFEIGLLADDLEEVARLVEKTSEAEYQRMRLNMQPLAEAISSGKCLATAMSEILTMMPAIEGRL